MKWLRARLGGGARVAQIGGTLALAIAFFTIGFAAGHLSPALIQALDSQESALEPILQALEIIEDRFVDAVARDRLVDGALAGMVDALDDEHSAYVPPELYQRSIDFSGEFTGIGVTIEKDAQTDAIAVFTVIPDSPAAAVGVQPGDIFYAVDGQRVVGMSQAELSALVPGPRGSLVNIIFQRGEALLEFDITRETFPLPNVSWQIVGENIAHISMQHFNDLSRAQLDEALAAAAVNEGKGLIFDMRDNQGGTLESAIEIGGAFLKDSLLLRQVARDGEEELTYTDGAYADITVPIVVLLDEYSASAAEVVAGALQDHGVATIIGERTFGKGTVQNIPPLANGGGLRLTVRRWLSPNGNSIHQQGIEPDIVIEWDPETEADAQADAQLTLAIEFLHSLRDS